MMPRNYKEGELYPYTVMLKPDVVKEVDKIAEELFSTRGHIMRMMIISGINNFRKFSLKNSFFDLTKINKKSA